MTPRPPAPVLIPGLDRPLAPLIMGSGSGTPTADEAKYFDLLDRYAALGGNAVDTGVVYGRGRSETVLGRWLSRGGDREKFIIIDKGCHPIHGMPRVTPEALREDVAGSVGRLGRPIDLFMFHRDNLRVPIAPLVDAVNQEMAEGRVRAFGVSNWTVARIREAGDYAAAHGLKGPVCSSPNLSLGKPKYPIWPGSITADAAMIAWHIETRFPLLSWTAQTLGFFSGKYSPETDAEDWIEDLFYTPGNFERLRRAKELAAKKGVTPNQVALAWVFHHPFPVAGIAGWTTKEEMDDSFGTLQVELTQEELEFLSGVKD